MKQDIMAHKIKFIIAGVSLVLGIITFIMGLLVREDIENAFFKAYPLVPGIIFFIIAFLLVMSIKD